MKDQDKTLADFINQSPKVEGVKKIIAAGPYGPGCGE